MSSSPLGHALRARSVVASVLAIAVIPLGAAPAQADPQLGGATGAGAPGATAAGPLATEGLPPGLTIAEPEPLLTAPARGSAALLKLGERLPVAADRNGLSPSALTTLLETDPTAWLDQEARLHYVDPLPAEGAPGAASASTPKAVAPLADTFALHSNPGADVTIFLDVDGATVAGTAWNAAYPDLPDGDHPAWDPAGNGPGFTDAEKTTVQAVWAAVAEDYAAFDVDVTTEDPGEAALRRTDSSDTRYGTRALISPSDAAGQAICDNRCGGVAYIDVVGDTRAGGGYYQPAWVFAQNLFSAKDVAEAVSHEVGHNLSLKHDGNATQGYDDGHGSWAPIMGVGYYRPLTQWSKGDYPGASNQQDDVAEITARLGPRADEAGDEPGSFAALPEPGEAAYITSRDDVDRYALGRCTADATVAVVPAPVAPDLDVRAEVRAPDGSLVTADDPAVGTRDRATATGLGATVSPGAGRNLELVVDGVGHRTWTTDGYDDYASLGAYTLEVDGCDGVITSVPSEPRSVTADSRGSQTQLTVAWTEPEDAGLSPVTGYVVRRTDGGEPVEVGAAARTATVTGLDPGRTYDLTVAAVNDRGTSPVAAVSASTAAQTLALAATAPSAPTDVRGRWNGWARQYEIYWQPPADDGGSPVTGYNVYHPDFGIFAQVEADQRSFTLTGDFEPGPYALELTAVNAEGESPRAAGSVEIPAPPANDDIADATPISGEAGSVEATNDSSTFGSGDPVPPSEPGRPNLPGGHSVWFTWTSPVTETVRFATLSDDETRDTTLGVYAGDQGDPASLSLVGGRDDNGPDDPLSAKTVEVVEGETYLIAVDGFDSDQGVGPFTLEWKVAANEVVPASPTTVLARAGDTTVDVSWDHEYPGFSTITYVATASPGGETCTVTRKQCTVAGLDNGTDYTFTVVASNDLGASDPSVPSNSATPELDEDPPTLDTATVTPSRVPADGGTVSVRVATADPGTGLASAPTVSFENRDASVRFGSTKLALASGDRYDGTYAGSVVVPDGLAAGSYTLRVEPLVDRSGNASPAVTRDAALAVGTPATPEAAPVTQARPGRTVRLTWPVTTDDGGYALTGYEVEDDRDPARRVTVDATTEPTADLAYPAISESEPLRFRYRAVNEAGPGAWSPWTSTTTVPAEAPDAPSDVTATRGDAASTVTWAASAGNGAPVSSYTATASPVAGGADATCTTAGATTCTVEGLTNGTAYAVTVVATNTRGDSAPSQAASVTPAARPTAPSGVTATRIVQGVKVGWQAADGQGEPVTRYTVTASPGGKKCVTAELTCDVTGLTNGVAYTVTVVATNAIGDSPASEPAGPVTPAGKPSAPTGVTAARGDRSVTASWQAAAGNGSPVTGYTATASPGGATCSTTGATTCSVEGLTNGVAYTVTVVATNAIGDSPASSPSSPVTPNAVPGAPTDVDATRGNRLLAVSWTAATGDVTGYTATASPGGAACTTGGATACTITGLTNGTAYTVTVVATNAVGDSPASRPSAPAVPATTPTAPGNVRAVPADGAATVRWDAASGRGSAVTGYTVTAEPVDGGQVGTCTTDGGSTSCTVPGLTNGASYRFRVVATNDVGDSAAATTSQQTVVGLVPTAPTGVGADRRNRSATVTWEAADGRGSPVGSYTVTASPGGATCTSATTTCVVPGLANGTAYTFAVVATNAVGGSAPSLASSEVVPAGRPGRMRPPRVTLRRGGRTVVVRWAAARDNGAPVLRYKVSIRGARNKTVPGTRTKLVLKGLKRRKYTVKVQAVNEVGISRASRAVAFRVRR